MKINLPLQFCLLFFYIFLNVLYVNGQITVYHGTIQEINSTGIVGTLIDDSTDHTYSIASGNIGAFSNATITRIFSSDVKSVTLTIVAGHADDVGYVGNIPVTPVQSGCFGGGTVESAVDVTSQVTISGNSVSVTLRAKETCCFCVGGWGEDNLANSANARLHWIVSLDPCARLKQQLHDFEILKEGLKIEIADIGIEIKKSRGEEVKDLIEKLKDRIEELQGILKGIGDIKKELNKCEKEKGNKKQKNELSSVTNIHPNGAKELNMQINSNPVINECNLTIFSSREQTVQIIITDLLGKRILTKQERLMANSNNRTHFNISSLPKGLYIVSVVASDGFSKSLKFVKE